MSDFEGKDSHSAQGARFYGVISVMSTKRFVG